VNSSGIDSVIPQAFAKGLKCPLKVAVLRVDCSLMDQLGIGVTLNIECVGAA